MRVKCAKCGTTAEFKPWTYGYNHHAAAHYWKYERDWEFNPHNKKSCICPECKAKGVIMATPKPAMVARPQANGQQVPAALPEVVASPPPPPPPEPPPAPASQVLSRDQRHKVREMLDTHFDDELGRYTKDWSDKRIAESLDVREVSVRELREAAYGPIAEDDPELIAMRVEFEAFKHTMTEFEQQFDTFKAMYREFEHRLAELERRGLQARK